MRVEGTCVAERTHEAFVWFLPCSQSDMSAAIVAHLTGVRAHGHINVLCLRRAFVSVSIDAHVSRTTVSTPSHLRLTLRATLALVFNGRMGSEGESVSARQTDHQRVRERLRDRGL